MTLTHTDHWDAEAKTILDEGGVRIQTRDEQYGCVSIVIELTGLLGRDGRPVILGLVTTYPTPDTLPVLRALRAASSLLLQAGATVATLQGYTHVNWSRLREARVLVDDRVKDEEV